MGDARAGGRIGQGGSVDGLFPRSKLEARRDERWVEDRGFGGGWRGGRGWGGQEEKDFVGHGRWAEDVYVIGICDEHASLA